MTSKEALERLVKYANIQEARLMVKYGYSALNDIEIIKQDLEILEILKKHLTDIIIGKKLTTILNIKNVNGIVLINDSEFQEDYKKIKEWLKNA